MNVLFVKGFSDLLFPARCHGCNQQIGQQCRPQLCSICFSLLSPLASPLCSCCGTPFSSGVDHLCGRCLRKDFSFNRARSLFAYEEPISSLLVSFKFAGHLSMLDTLSALALQAKVESLVQIPDWIIPVPLHKNRLQSRGFNQALLLAIACFPNWQKHILRNVLCRHKQTIPQTELSGKARRNNLKRAFKVNDVEILNGRSILLVDDVFTTGSTLHECAKVLTKAGAGPVEAFTLARVF